MNEISLFSKLKLDTIKPGKIVTISVVIILLGFIGYKAPGGDDWYGVFLPATRLLMSGSSPYNESMFFSPVWALLPFIPLAYLPPILGRSILFVVALCVYAFSAWRFGAKPVAVLAFLLSPSLVMSLWLSSIDWMPILGFVLPPQIGLFFILVKPQMGSIVALFWFVEAIRKGGWKKVLKIFLPVTTALIVTFGLYGLWPLQASSITSIGHNASLWPVSIPVGFGLVVASFRKHEINYAMAASPCLSPYVMFTSWSVVLMSMLSCVPEIIAVLVGSWILVYLRIIG